METIQILLLAFIQGLTEFLPISSSAHLILLPNFFAWKDQGLVFDIAVHLGTLVAVIWYFYKDIKLLFFDLFASIVKQQTIGDSKLAWGLILATIPVSLVGLLFKEVIETSLRSTIVIAYTTLIFGIVLGIADYVNRQYSHLKTQLSWSIMLLVGISQTIALIPGVSRSGITLSAILLLGVNRRIGMQFVFLLSIPVIMLSSGLAISDLLAGKAIIAWLDLFIAIVVSAICAYIVIAFFMRFIEKMSLMPFVIYRILLALLIFLFYD